MEKEKKTKAIINQAGWQRPDWRICLHHDLEIGKQITANWMKRNEKEQQIVGNIYNPIVRSLEIGINKWKQKVVVEDRWIDTQGPTELH